jgi:hypothetical protein
MDEPGTVLEPAIAGKTLVQGNHDRLQRGRPSLRLRATAEPNQSRELWRSWLWGSVLFVILAALPYSVTIGGTGPCVVRACAQPVAQHPYGDQPKRVGTSCSAHSNLHFAPAPAHHHERPSISGCHLVRHQRPGFP